MRPSRWLEQHRSRSLQTWAQLCLAALAGLMAASGPAGAQRSEFRNRAQYKAALTEYMDIGHRDPKWDKLVLEGLNLLLIEDNAAAARPRFQKAFDLGCHDLEVLYRLGQACLATGAKNKGKGYLKMAAAQYERERYRRIHAAKPSIVLGDLSKELGDLEGAIEFYRHVSARVKARSAEEKLQRYADKLKPIRELQRQFEKKPDADLAVKIALKYYGVGRSSGRWWESGNVVKRGEWLDKAIELNPDHAEALWQRIICYWGERNYHPGEALIPRAITAAKNSKKSRDLPLAHRASALILLSQGYNNPVKKVLDRLGKPAHAHALAAVQTARGVDEDWVQYVTNHVLAQSYWSWSGRDLRKSIEQLKISLSYAEKNKWKYRISQCRALIGKRYENLKDYEQARKWLGPSYKPPEDAQTVAFARKHYRAYREQVEMLESDLTRWTTEHQKRARSTHEDFVSSYSPYIAACLRLGRFEEAYVAAERAYAASFLALMGGKMRERRTALNDRRQARSRELAAAVEAARTSVSQARRQGKEQEVASAQRDLTVKSQMLQTVNARIEVTAHELKILSSVDPLPVHEVQPLLGDATLILYCGYIPYRGYPKESFAAVVTQDSFQVVQGLKMSVHAARNWAKAFRKGLDRSVGKAKPDPEFEKWSSEIYRRVFKPVRPHIKTRQLIIVPYGGLNLVPFQCLKNEKGRYLVEDYAITMVPSGSVLKLCRSMPRPDLRRVLTLANPNLPDPGSGLKFAESEAEAVSDLFPEKLTLRGVEATESAFAELAPGYDVLHLACHGIMHDTDPMLSNLRLARDDKHDGVLHVREIFDLDLSAGLVTLSACNTGVGEVSGSGFEFMGMTRAFLHAGTPSVVASLWRVDDKATSELMAEFYRDLRTMDRAQALQRAQVAMMKKYDNPYYWGAFVLYGDYR